MSDQNAEKLLPLCLKIRNLGIRERTSNFQGKKVTYFKGKDFMLSVFRNKEWGKFNKDLSNQKNICDFGDELIESKLIIRVEAAFRNEKSKTPLSLYPSRSRKFEREGFYLWSEKVAKKKWWQAPLLMFLVIGVILACCFPIWPIWAKLGLWYLSVILLCLILGVTLIRYIVFCLLFIFGIEFWIFPNMYDDRAGFWETLTPIYFYRKRDISCCDLTFRILFFLLFIAAGTYFYLFPETFDHIQEVTVGGIKDLVNWGEEKILSNSTQIAGIPNYRKYDEVLDEEVVKEIHLEDEEY